MEDASTINTAVTANVIMVKRSQRARKSVKNDAAMEYVVQWNHVVRVQMIVVSAPRCLGVEMVRAMEMRTVEHVLEIVALAPQPSIVATIFVIMEKTVIAVEPIVPRAHLQVHVEIHFVIQHLKRVRLVQPTVVIVLEFVEMGHVI